LIRQSELTVKEYSANAIPLLPIIFTINYRTLVHVAIKLFSLGRKSKTDIDDSCFLRGLIHLHPIQLQVLDQGHTTNPHKDLSFPNRSLLLTTMSTRSSRCFNNPEFWPQAPKLSKTTLLCQVSTPSASIKILIPGRQPNKHGLILNVFMLSRMSDQHYVHWKLSTKKMFYTFLPII
jgi:hypothetical protein